MGPPVPACDAPVSPLPAAGARELHRHILHHRCLLLLGVFANLIFGFLPKPCSWDHKKSLLERLSILVYSGKLRRQAEKSCRAGRQGETPKAEAQPRLPAPGLSTCTGLAILLLHPAMVPIHIPGTSAAVPERSCRLPRRETLALSANAMHISRNLCTRLVKPLEDFDGCPALWAG